MNWDRIEGDWKQFVGKVKEKWSKHDDIAAINGKREQLDQSPHRPPGNWKNSAQRPAP